MFFFFFKERHWDQQRECGVYMSGCLESPVESLLDILPKSPTVWSDDHAAPDWGIICQLRFDNELVIPFGEIITARREFVIRHGVSFLLSMNIQLHCLLVIL
jgi:hypothetical protein